MSKADFLEQLDIVERAYKGWSKALEALGIVCSEDEILLGIDKTVDLIAKASGNTTLPKELDTNRLMRHCGNDMPLVIWWCWENEFGAVGRLMTIAGVTYPTATAEDLWDIIQVLNEKTALG
jgi:hypothetical protein